MTAILRMRNGTLLKNNREGQMPNKETETTKKEIGATRTLKKIMAKHFYELDEAAKRGSQKIAW